MYTLKLEMDFLQKIFYGRTFVSAVNPSILESSLVICTYLET